MTSFTHKGRNVEVFPEGETVTWSYIWGGEMYGERGFSSAKAAKGSAIARINEEAPDSEMYQLPDGSWVPLEPIPEPWTWKWVRRWRKLRGWKLYG